MDKLMEYRLGDVIPEMNHLVELQIFSDIEIKKIMKTRCLFQQKLRKRSSKYSRYIQYITYEINLLDLVKSRREKLNPPDKSDFDMSIASRVNKLYKLAIIKYHKHIFLWLQYIKFCKAVRAFSMCVTDMFVDVLAVHRCKPKLWKLAARWEFKENKSVDKASQYLMRGLIHFPSSKVLYIEIFRMELLYADIQCKQLKSKENKDKQDGKKVVPGASSSSGHVSGLAVASTADQGDISVGHPPEGLVKLLKEVLQDPNVLALALKNYGSSDPAVLYKNANYIYDAASKKIPDTNYLTRFLKIANKFKFTEKLQQKVIRDFLFNAANNETTWNNLVLLYLHRSLIGSSADEEPISGIELKSEIEKIEYNRIAKCSKLYHKGLERWKTELMWKLYLDTLIEIYYESSVLNEFKLNLLLQELRKAHEEGNLLPLYYILWADLCTGQSEELRFILDAAATKFESSFEFWQKHLKSNSFECDEETVKKVIQLVLCCMECRDEYFRPLWNLLTEHTPACPCDGVTELLEDINKQGLPLSFVCDQIISKWQKQVKDIDTHQL